MRKVVVGIVIVVIVILIVLLAVFGGNRNSETEDVQEDEEEVITEEDMLTATEVDVFLGDLSMLTSDEVTANAEAQMAEPNEGDTLAIFHVESYGDMTVKFFEDVAPLACENFITLAEEGYYDGLTFHRIISEFMIQGGDPNGDGTGGESIYGEDFGEELSETILPYKGALCMASRGTGTTSLGSQFFIVNASYDEDQDSFLDYYGYSNLQEARELYGGDLYDLIIAGQYTTFGQVIDGFDVLDKISSVEVDANNNSKPLEDVVISSIEIVTYGE